ncbi:hypothetical protein DPMN_135308 [Dreissena polymorpha]|uniref:Uncharacterized protein n=1 Tax=Dreissena polymorpha TaxID=45954 RepID=A0A9D4JGP7_DREPO|nr:hypothetical protein DPMN_135308 [Dreissena polymorpha]
MWCVPVARKCNAAKVEMSGGRGQERSVALSKFSMLTRNRIVSGKNRYRSRISIGVRSITENSPIHWKQFIYVSSATKTSFNVGHIVFLPW